MARKIKKQACSHSNVPDRYVGNRSSWLSQLAFTAITTFCVSISTTAWADTESFDLSDFDGVSAAEGIHMHVTKGDAFAVSAESDDPEQLERLELDIRRGILRAKMDYGLFSLNWAEKKTVTVRVTMPNLNHVEASTGAEIMADTMSGSNTELAANTGSTLEVNAIDGGSMSVDVSNGGHIKIAEGACTSLSASVSEIGRAHV